MTEDALIALEVEVAAALLGLHADLDVIGYGEISTVLALEAGRPMVAKRLPPMSDAQTASYAATLASYLGELERRGVAVAPSTTHRVPTPLGGRATYVVQPRFDTLLPEVLRTTGITVVRSLFEALAGHVDAVVDDRLGFDAQVSNWAVAGGGLVYLDVTTPLCRDDRGEELLDTEIFLASLPPLLRPAVRRFALPDILATYYDRRRILLDAAANLFKERLDALVPTAAVVFSERVDPPITTLEARRYYRANAVLWEVLQRLRRLDAWWSRTIRRRPYPFLLPPKIER